MAEIGKATVEVNLTKSRTVALLEEILDTLKTLEERSNPVQTTNNIEIKTGKLDEDQLAEVAARQLYWDIASSKVENPFTKPETKEFMDDVLAQVESSAEGEPVKIGEPCKKFHFDTIEAREVQAGVHHIAFGGLCFEPVVYAGYDDNDGENLRWITGSTGITWNLPPDHKVLVSFCD